MVGRRIVRVELRRPDLRTPFPRRFARRLTGATTLALTRRAKYLLAALSSGESLLMHLGMSGSFRVERNDGLPRRHDHVVLHLTGTFRPREARARENGKARRSLALYSRPMAELRKTVLVVDSDEMSREALSGALRRDYRVLRTATGESAVHMAEREGVDVMLLDVTLPGISAIEVLKIVKENYPHVAVVVTSPVGK